ncbi:MAG TPA: hypothetical protein VF200_04240 [Woeseiaceae bacterium]
MQGKFLNIEAKNASGTPLATCRVPKRSVTGDGQRIDTTGFRRQKKKNKNKKKFQIRIPTTYKSVSGCRIQLPLLKIKRVIEPRRSRRGVFLLARQPA